MESTIERTRGTAPARLVCERCQAVPFGLLKEQNIIVTPAINSSLSTNHVAVRILSKCIFGLPRSAVRFAINASDPQWRSEALYGFPPHDD